jgi:hypothetical protein
VDVHLHAHVQYGRIATWRLCSKHVRRKSSLPQRDAGELVVFTGAMSVSHSACRMQQKRLPFDKTMPASGTHSLEPSLRGRGLRLSGSWSKVARTQSAMASAPKVMVLIVEHIQTWRGGGSSEVLPGANDIGAGCIPSLRSQTLLPLCRSYPVAHSQLQ